MHDGDRGIAAQIRAAAGKERDMTFDGTAALKLDFGGTTTTSTLRGGRAGLRLAVPSGGLRGPDKYKVLEHRRRQAQIRARHLLDLMEEGQ